MATNKHLTDLERLEIEQYLINRISLKRIAESLGKSTSTISREIRAHALDSNKYPAYRIHNRCIKRTECQRRHLCNDKPNCVKRCSSCKLCNDLCEDYEEQICYKLYDPPYVCNGCSDEHKCVLRKKYYLHKKAHEAYREKLIESRVGANISEEELLALDEFVSPLLMRGQSVHHIFANNPDQFDVSEKSVYRYVDGGLLKARNIDMPRVCRLKPRKSKPVVHKIDKSCRIGRSFAEFSKLMEVDRVAPVEMDSVVGRFGGKVLLTLLFKSCDFMLAFIRERNTSQSVIDCFNHLFGLLGADCFKRMFPVILTDNGSEFSNPTALELDAQGNRRTYIYYCDPYASFQKPNVELNHEFLRKILPKGLSFDNLTQADINLAMSHINSYSREKLNDRAPLDVFSLLFDTTVLDKLDIRKIYPNDIVLKPSLLRK